MKIFELQFFINGWQELFQMCQSGGSVSADGREHEKLLTSSSHNRIKVRMELDQKHFWYHYCLELYEGLSRS